MATYTSRQIKKPIIREDTGIACASRAWLWREGRRIGDVVDIIVNDDDFTGIDIHQMRDLMLAEKALEKSIVYAEEVDLYSKKYKGEVFDSYIIRYE